MDVVENEVVLFMWDAEKSIISFEFVKILKTMAIIKYLAK